MATTLPPIVHSPFGRHLDHSSYAFKGLKEPYPTIENVSTTTLASVISVNPRQTSTSSVLSVASAPLQPRINDNRCDGDGLPTHPGKRSMSLQVPYPYARTPSTRPGKLRRSQVLRPRHNLGFSTVALPRTNQFQALHEPSAGEPQDAKSGADGFLPGHLGQRLSSLTPNSITEHTTSETANGGILGGRHGADRDDGKFRHWANTFRRRKNVPPPTIVRQIHGGQTLRIPGQDLSLSAHTSPKFRSGHGKRLSNASSGFVETVKTASFSNTSISVGPRSHPRTLSAETRGNRGSNVRYSIDSDRPIARPSLDEGAMCRGLRRRQILREILMSEESYLVDLRALSNLFSTLLASVASLSTSAKTNIQRNLHEMLQLHTEITNELRRVSVIETATHRISDSRLRRPELHNHVKCNSSETYYFHGIEGQPRRTRHSIDSIDSNAVLHTAEPREAAEIARAFKSFIARSFVYEDYCSNHEVMVRALIASQRSISSWSSYETGIEALTRSICAINHRRGSNKRAMTVGDLLMSPIQRLTKYPLLFADLHKSTPVIDCPDSHAEVDLTLQHLRELVRSTNQVTDDHIARERIRKRWLLQDRLAFSDEILQASQFRMLGHPILCGVLHLAYQTKTQVRGGYGLCILFETHMIMAVPVRQANKFDIVAVIHLSDLKTESTSDGKGLQCHTALYSWKVVFESDQQLFEIILSACSAAEEEQWKLFMERRREISGDDTAGVCPASPEPFTAVNSDLKPVGGVFGQAGTLARRLSVQRAATVGTRINMRQVIIRNTHKTQETHNSRVPSANSIHRSQSLLTTHKTVILAPKRNERIRLEYALGDVWTRDKLPYPGMTSSRSGQIIRASAGSLVRKLSLASMHGPFTRRSVSLTTANRRRSTETFLDVSVESEADHQKYSIVDETKTLNETQEDSVMTEEQAGELEAEGRPERQSLPSVERLIRNGTKKLRRLSLATVEVPTVADETSPGQVDVEEKLGGRKRWSNPLSLLKNFATEGVQHLLNSSK